MLKNNKSVRSPQASKAWAIPAFSGQSPVNGAEGRSLITYGYRVLKARPNAMGRCAGGEAGWVLLSYHAEESRFLADNAA